MKPFKEFIKEQGIWAQQPNLTTSGQVGQERPPQPPPPSIANVTAGLYADADFTLWDVSPKYQEIWDAYIAAGGAWSKGNEWPGLPVFIDPETGENVQFELPEPGEWSWPPPMDSPQYQYWVSVIMWFVGNSVRPDWPGDNANWNDGYNDSPLWRIWLQSGQPELPQSFINLMSALLGNNQFWILMIVGGVDPNTGEPIGEGHPWYSYYVMFWEIFFGGQWGEGGQD